MPSASRRFTSGPFLPCSRVTTTERDADAQARAAAQRGSRAGAAKARRSATSYGARRHALDAAASARLRCAAQHDAAAACCGAAARIALMPRCPPRCLQALAERATVWERTRVWGGAGSAPVRPWRGHLSFARAPCTLRLRPGHGSMPRGVSGASGVSVQRQRSGKRMPSALALAVRARSPAAQGARAACQGHA
jgi:hypothetical protein